MTQTPQPAARRSWFWRPFRELPLWRRILAGTLLAVLAGIGGFGAWMMAMPGRSWRGALPPLTTAQADLATALRGHVQKLAGEIGVRNLDEAPQQLEAAAAYIKQTFSAHGYTVQSLAYPLHNQTAENIEIVIPAHAAVGRADDPRAAHAEAEAGCIVVGAHYDSAEACPAANDNASGVAALLELARMLEGRHFTRPVRLVAFANEEPPYFWTELMGSAVYAQSLQAQNIPVTAMLSLETIGYYSDEPGSQQFPAPALSLFYPTRGDYIAFIGNTASRGLVRTCVKTFRQHAQFPSEGIATFESVPGIGWSDHWAFWQIGCAALMVTDTAPFRYAHYHTPQDTPDKLDYERMARVVEGLAAIVAGLAGEPDAELTAEAA